MAFHNKNFIKKYKRIQKRFNEEYKKGFRREVIIEVLEDEFMLSESRLNQILTLDFPDEKPQHIQTN